MRLQAFFTSDTGLEYVSHRLLPPAPTHPKRALEVCRQELMEKMRCLDERLRASDHILCTVLELL